MPISTSYTGCIMSEGDETLYSKALFAAYEELSQLTEQERAIAVRKAQLKQTVDALYPLVFDDAVDIKSLSLPDALRLVLRSSGRALNAHEFKTKLDDVGFDLEKYSDPIASILTAMNRMVEAGEMQFIPNAPRKTVEATQELKAVPDAPALPPVFAKIPMPDFETPQAGLEGLAEIFKVPREKGGSK